MKCRVSSPLRRLRSAFSIIECLVYIGVLAVILNLGGAALFRGLEYNRALQHDADAVTRALQAGEQWRADLRAATAAPQPGETAGMTTLDIPQRGTIVAYAFRQNAVWRRNGTEGEWRRIIPDVRWSEMSREQRIRTEVWRWEVELKSSGNHTRLRPLFTFLAVTPEEAHP